MSWLFGSHKGNTKPSDVYLRLRFQLLSAQPETIGLSPAPENPAQLWGVVVELSVAGTIATLVSLVDGSTNLHFSNNASVLGDDSTKLANASRGLMETASSIGLKHMTLATDYPLPGEGRVRFYALWFGGVSTAEASEQELTSHRHPLSPVFEEAQRTIAELRTAAERNAANGPLDDSSRVG